MSSSPSRPGWTWCPACRMHVPDPYYAEFCEPMLAEAAGPTA